MVVDPERVGALIRAVSREELLPRFRRLAARHVSHKPTDTDPDDVVTTADLAAEARLTTELTALLPGSVVVGEEAVAAAPGLLAAVTGTAPVWLVDPLDGTRNFVGGETTFGTMVALMVEGVTRCGWLYLPVEDALLSAEAGAGATLDGARLRAGGGPRPAVPPRGTVYTRFMPLAVRTSVEGRAARHTQVVAGPGSACVEYAALARGTKDFAVYWRLHPWDHAPGALILTEAGGACAHPPGGVPYHPRDASQATLLTRSADMWPALAEELFGED